MVGFDGCLVWVSMYAFHYPVLLNANQFPPVDGELISINGGDTLSITRTLPNTEKVGHINVHV